MARGARRRARAGRLKRAAPARVGRELPFDAVPHDAAPSASVPDQPGPHASPTRPSAGPALASRRESPAAARVAGWILAAAALATCASACARILRTSEAEFVSWFPCDDSYYFFQVARNLARGLGPSFDGLNLTDGFRPVWGFALVPVQALAAAPLQAAQWSCVLGALLHVAGLVLLQRVLAPGLGALPAALACAAALIAPELRAQGWNGMDWSTNLFLECAALALVARCWRASANGRRASGALLLGTGAVLGLNLIERPETALLIALLALPALRARELRTLALTALGLLALALPFYAWSLATFGSLSPVPALIKGEHALATWTPARSLAALEKLARLPSADLAYAFDARVLARAPELELPLRLAGRALPWTLLLGGLALAVAGARRARSASAASGAATLEPSAEQRVQQLVARRVLLAIFGFALLHALLASVMLHPYLDYGRWYGSPQDVAMVALLALALRALARWLPARVAAGAAALACVALAANAYGHERAHARRAPPSPGAFELRSLEVARWIEASVPAGERVGVFNAGQLGYFADNRVTNLDGLVNTQAFARRIWAQPDPERLRVELLAYLIEEDLGLILDVWERAYEGRIPAAYFQLPALAQMARLERAWPFDEGNAQLRAGSFQAYRLDLDALRAWIAERAQRGGTPR